MDAGSSLSWSWSSSDKDGPGEGWGEGEGRRLRLRIGREVWRGTRVFVGWKCEVVEEGARGRAKSGILGFVMVVDRRRG